MKPRLAVAVLAEFVGTMLLLAAVIGSGIMAQRLGGGNMAVALLTNTLATVFALYVLIETLGAVSGAHFNPVVTLVLAARGLFRPQRLVPGIVFFVLAQLAGAVAGAWLAHAMFEMPLAQVSTQARDGWGQWIGEVVATAGLVLVILRAPAGRSGPRVAAFIGAAYWFTSSTSFANPAAVAGRMLTDSFSGIAPGSALAFVGAELAGGVIGALLASLFAESRHGRGPRAAPSRDSNISHRNC